MLGRRELLGLIPFSGISPKKNQNFLNELEKEVRYAEKSGLSVPFISFNNGKPNGGTLSTLMELEKLNKSSEHISQFVSICDGTIHIQNVKVYE